jgi:hypothetical protein
MRRAGLLLVFGLLLAGCQPHGPVATLGLGWWHKDEDLTNLEEVFVLHGFQPELQDYLSAESAKESVKPWRYKSDGVIYAYFVFPAAVSSASTTQRYREAVFPLRAILSLTEGMGRLNVGIGGPSGDCSTKRFVKSDEELIEGLALRIGERFKRKIRVRYIDSERC